MSARTRLVALLLGIHLLTTLGAAGLAWWWLDREVQRSEEARAQAIAQVLADGGFALNPAIQQRMETLAGTTFREVTASTPPVPGSVRAQAGSHLIEVDLPRSSARVAGEASLFAVGWFLAGGALSFALAAWWSARVVERPVARLAAEADRLGNGDLAGPVAQAGSGAVAAIAQALERMRCRLQVLEADARRQERLRTLGSFAAIIAHEVRNPLSAIRLTVQMLRRQRPDPALLMMESEVERLDLSVDSLLGFARGMTVQKTACNLHTEAMAVLALLQRQADHAGVGLDCRVVGTPGPVLADATRIRQVVLNLVLNAIQALAVPRSEPVASDPLVVVEIHADGLAVIDNGPGVAASIRPHLFAAFTSGRTQGTGLGLHIARTIAEAHGATLACTDEPSGGARFTLAGLRPCTSESGPTITLAE